MTAAFPGRRTMDFLENPLEYVALCISEVRAIYFWIPLAIVVSFLIGAVAYFGPRELLQSIVISVSEDTAYAPGYSESAFQEIAIGDTESGVREALGPPLKVFTANPCTIWLYTPDSDPVPAFEANGSYPDMRYSFTAVRFGEDGAFVEAFGQISHGSKTSPLDVSASALFLGDGTNTLPLTSAEIEKLKSEKATADQIEARLGKPRSVFRCRARKWLQYSHSPGSKNYRLRMIGIDRDGKVSRVRREFYWD